MNRQFKWAHAKRKQMKAALGGCCVQCGSKRKLELDHVDFQARSWKASQVGFVRATTLYAQDLKANLLQLLCRRCHKAKSRQEQVWVHLSITVDYRA